MSDIKIVIGADVASAVTGIEKVNGSLFKFKTELSKSSAGMTSVNAALLNTSNAAKTTSFTIEGIGSTFQRVTPKMGAMSGIASSLKSNLLSIISPTHLVITAITAIGAALYAFVTKESKAEIAMKSFIENAKESKKASAGIYSELSKEATQVQTFIGLLNSETESRQRKLAAINELQKINPDVFAGLKLEGNLVTGLDAAYKSYIANLQAVLSIKMLQRNLDAVTEKIIIAQGGARTKEDQKAFDMLEKFAKLRRESDNLSVRLPQLQKEGKAQDELNYLLKEQINLVSQITELSRGIKVTPLKTDDLKISTKKIEVENVGKITFSDDKEALKLPVEFDFKSAMDINKSGAFRPFLDLVKKSTAVPIQTTGAIDPFFINLEKKREALKEFANIATSVLSPAFDSLFENIGKGTKSVIKGLGLVIKELTIAVFKALALYTIKALITGGGSLGKDFLGGFFKSFFGGGKASGSTAGRGGMTLVGERGPELVSLPSGSSVMPNNQLQAFGNGGINLMPSIAYDGTMFRIFLNRVDAQISRNG